MATSLQTAENSPGVARPIPPLRNGDHLDADRSTRRYQAMPHRTKAEWLDGRVYVDSPHSHPNIQGNLKTSPVSFKEPSALHVDLIGWMAIYRCATPEIRGGDNGTVRVDPKTVPQPDGLLLIQSTHGGQTSVGPDKFVQGPPKLVAEVVYRSVSHDLREKLEIDLKHGAREYLAWRVEDHSIEWFVARSHRFEPIRPGDN